ncbi:hypothetical protein BD560DRAFT_355137 [Blakeslea trispora]|nr:hypothetical protein BD560DRAFT_355137 [Blakeslea trispora]
MAALSFCYAPPLSGQYDQYVKHDEALIISELQDICQKTMTARGCQISVMTTKSTKQLGPNANYPTEFNISMTGSPQALMKARGDLLSHCPLEIKLKLRIPPNPSLSILTDHFDQLEKELETKITLVPEQANLSSLVSDNTATIEIVGHPTQVEQCRVRVLVAIDEIMYSFKTEIVRMPLKLQYLICGRKRTGLLPIIEETSTNIYFSSPFIHTESTDNSLNTDTTDQQEHPTDPPIYITGEQVHVLRVKDMLNKLAVQKAKSMYHKDTALYARKIDWLLLHRRDELRKIMHDNGAYIEFPSLGSGDNRVTVYAENRVNAERTLRALNFQACTIYEACFYFNNNDGAIYDPTGSHAFFESTSNISNLVSQLSQVSGSEVVYKTDPGCIEVLGAERAIRNVYQRLQEMQFLQVFHQYTVFRVESSNDQRDFISGKKNGKINKIMKTSGAKIRFVTFINDYNFVIEVESTSFTKALDGLTLLQEELPAEISFYVPESYHKRIIGVGGKNIQRIMKKYGVYVKFSNTEEFASLGGYYNNEDNVVARTPMKNQINLDNLRHAVMELIHPKDRDYIDETIEIPFQLHRSLIHDYQDSFINEEVTKKTNTHVLWPDAELASNTVELLGPEAHMALAIKMLESIVPESYDLHVPSSQAFYQAIQSELFQEHVVNVLDHKFGITVKSSVPANESVSKDNTPVNSDAATSKTSKENHLSGQDGFIRLSTTKDKMPSVLKDALATTIDFLKNQKVPLYENTTADALFSRVEKKQHLTSQKSNLSASSSSSLLDNALLNKHQPTQAIVSGVTGSSTGTVGSAGTSIMPPPPMNIPMSTMGRSETSSDPIYPMGGNMTQPIVSQAYPFYHFQANKDMPLDSNQWIPVNSHNNRNNTSTNAAIVAAAAQMQAQMQAHIQAQLQTQIQAQMQAQQQQQQSTATASTTSLQSNGSDSNLRAIFDAPLELTDQERAVLSNYRYQRMSMPPPPSASSNFGFPQTMSSSTPASDIWSTPTSQIASNRRSTGAFPSGSITSPPSNNRRTTSTSYASAATNDNIKIRRYNENNPNTFYPGMGGMGSSSEFNPYNDIPHSSSSTTTTSSLKSSQSMPEPMLEAHFNVNRPPFQTSPSFHANQAQAFGQLNISNYRVPSKSTSSNTNASFVTQNTPPQHEQTQFFVNSNEANAVQNVFEKLSNQSTGSSGYDPRRQHDQDDKGSRAPPGIDI